MVKINLKKMLGLRQGSISGLDIGSSSVKMIRLCRENNHYAVSSAAIVDFEDTAGDENRKQMSIINAVRECMSTDGGEHKLAICGVNGPDVVVRDFSFPLLPEDEIASAVHLEAVQLCPFDIEQATVDYQLMPVNNKHISGILVAVKNSLIDKKYSFIKQAELQCVSMGVDGLEILNCFMEIEKEQAGKSIAILNVGNISSTLIIKGNDSLPFIRDINCAGKVIDNKLMPSNNMAAACKELIDAINETMRYYTARHKSTSIEKTYVCGGFSQRNGFLEVLDKNLAAGAILWNPFEKMAWPINRQHNDILQKYGPSLVVAAGLAMRQFN